MEKPITRRASVDTPARDQVVQCSGARHFVVKRLGIPCRRSARLGQGRQSRVRELRLAISMPPNSTLISLALSRPSNITTPAPGLRLSPYEIGGQGGRLS